MNGSCCNTVAILTGVACIINTYSAWVIQSFINLLGLSYLTIIHMEPFIIICRLSECKVMIDCTTYLLIDNNSCQMIGSQCWNS